MLRLRRLEVNGFGPFADPQVIDFPVEPGVVVIYGENMRGKTSLLNAIRYAFFGTVLGRGSRARRLHTISNRDLATQGRHGFLVSLSFDYGGEAFELVRSCDAVTPAPSRDDDYHQSVLLKRGGDVLGPTERDRLLSQIFPFEVSRFFLFDGELLQEYEELLINESETGPRISEAIERILGVPILKRGRAHLKQLSDDAEKEAGREAAKHTETQAIGTALKQATERKEAHQLESARLVGQLKNLNEQRAELEAYLSTVQKYAGILEERDNAVKRFDQAEKDEKSCRGDLQRAMADAWRTVLREPVRTARAAAEAEAKRDFERLVLTLRAQAVAQGHCGTCDQEVGPEVKARLSSSLPQDAEPSSVGGVTVAMTRLADLGKFDDADNRGEVRQLWRRLRELQLEQVTLKEKISELAEALEDSDPDAVRRSKGSFTDLVEKISIIKRAIDQEAESINELDQNIQRLTGRLEATGTLDLRAGQQRARYLRQAAEIFGQAVDRYKVELRSRVETTGTKLFLGMTTEKQDYAGLTINDSYGLTIRHKDGRAEEARSAGAEHVVALALMGALQHNAPLRGPIVMDSPFGRLDEMHTSNVVKSLPDMAEQVVLLVYEAEVGRQQMRNLLGPRLLREYELERVSARRTNVQAVK